MPLSASGTISNPTGRKVEALLALLSKAPNTRFLIEHVLDVWPEHAAYLLANFQARSLAMLATTELASDAIRLLVAGREHEYAADYRWTCDRLREEELFFHREGRYRLSTYAEAMVEVYSNADYMTRYMKGLLLTQILWFNHAGTLEMFLDRFLGINGSFDYLEIGPGHGLMVYFAGRSTECRSIEAWDVSDVSIMETRSSLKHLGVTKPVALTKLDIMQAILPERSYDRIVISEVLEHLERPDIALRKLGQVMRPQGRMFINVPINSPSPDHIFLLKDPDGVRALIESSGLTIDTMELFATQGRPINKALANNISISAGVIAQRTT